MELNTTLWYFFFQAENGIRDLGRSRGLGDVYKRQEAGYPPSRHLDAFQYVNRENFHSTIHAGEAFGLPSIWEAVQFCGAERLGHGAVSYTHLTLPTSDLVYISVVAVSFKKENRSERGELQSHVEKK